jgi:hypothetical protein
MTPVHRCLGPDHLEEPFVRIIYEMADERLDQLLARGDVPPPWEAPDEHIAYPDEDVDSTVDDTNADPGFNPREHAVSDGSASSSSGEQSDEAEVDFADPASTKSVSKRGRSSSDDDSDASLVATVNTKRQKSSSGSARQSSGRQGTGHPQTSSKFHGTRRRKSALAAVDYSKFTVQELQMIKIPEDSDLSWMYCGVKVVRGNGRKAQMPGFPDYEHSSQQAKGH